MTNKKDRYVTFENIHCYNNAVKVLDAMYELFSQIPESKNAFWLRFEKELPTNYDKTYAKEGHRDILYLVCSNVFYISDLFEEYEFEKGSELLYIAEIECC